MWAHHQFVAGIDPRMANIFSVTTLLISIPIAEMVFLYIATLYGGSIRLDTPMLWALAFIAEFMIGGVTGIFLGSSGTDIYLHDTYFVIAHFHYTFVPIAIIAVFAGLTFWYPKMFGRMLNETLGKIHFWGTVIPFNVIFIPLFMTGVAGRPAAHLQLRPIRRAVEARAAASAHDLHDRAAGHAVVPAGLPIQFLLEHAPRQARRGESLEVHHARMDRALAAAARKFCRTAHGVSRPL